MIDRKFYELKSEEELIHLQKIGIERLETIKEILSKKEKRKNEN